MIGTSPLTAEAQCRLARAWRHQGKRDRAVASYRKALAQDPLLAPAYLELGAVLREMGNLDEAIAVLGAGIEQAPATAELHKEFIDALAARGGLDAADAAYELERQDTRAITLGPDDVLCCTVVRNEAARLPYFLAYYRARGVGHFFVVDNDSTDGTRPYLLAQPDVRLWRSSHSFGRANFGAAWFELLLRRYGLAHWCLIVDADELLVYADCERRGLLDLCRGLDRQGKRAFGAILLDMYSDRPIRDTHYRPGQPFLEVCPYFDRQYYHAKHENWSPYGNQTGYVGGMRQRVFGAEGVYNLEKMPLLRYDRGCVLIGGQHWTNRPRVEIADETGCLLHFKYFATFTGYVAQEVERAEHYGQGLQYRHYAAALADDAALTPYDPAHSVRYRDSAQLARLGIITPPAGARTAP